MTENLDQPSSILLRRAGLNERIHLLGAHTNAIDLLADSTVLLMPSAYEGLALVSYEAMSPWGFRKSLRMLMVNRSWRTAPNTGILVDNGPGEEIRYAQACLELLSDPDRRAHMAKGQEKETGQVPFHGRKRGETICRDL